MNKKRRSVPRPHPSIAVAIVEDDRRVGETLAQLVDSAVGLRCTGSFGSSEEALAGIGKDPPDVVLMDIGLPGASGIECTREIKALYPATEVLILTVYDDDDKILQSIRAGATGYILKSADRAELIHAIRDIRLGAPMSASIARRVLGLVGQRPDSPGRADGPFAGSGEAEETKSGPHGDMKLTSRELEILDSLVEGLSYKGIAEKLFISPLTVHSHIKHIYEKLHVHSMSAAVSKALKQGLTR
jgi:DNA-binding NarL/FixJ family response regulator